MRVFPLFVGAAVALVAGGACTRTEPAPGVLMLAVQTDLTASKTGDIQAVGLYVRDLDRGRTLFALTEPVAPDGTVRFPATLAIVGRNNPGASVRIRVVGFRSGEARVMREAVTTIPRDRVALLSLPLRWVNYDKTTGKMPGSSNTPTVARALAGASVDDPANDPFGLIFNTDPSCKGEMTYIDGACAPWSVDSTKLPDFVEADVFGGGTADGGGSCFDPEICFADATPIALDPATCLAPRPPGDFTLGVKMPPGSATGACFGDGCFIPLDPEDDEGWRSNPDGAIKLSAGNCARVTKGGFEIVSSRRCGQKAALAPICGPASTVGPGVDLPMVEAGVTPDAGDGGDGAIPTLPDGGPITAETIATAPASETPAALALDESTGALYYMTLSGKVYRLDAKGVPNQGPGGLIKDIGFAPDATISSSAELFLVAASGRVVVANGQTLYFMASDGLGFDSFFPAGSPSPVTGLSAASTVVYYSVENLNYGVGVGVYTCPLSGCNASPTPIEASGYAAFRQVTFDPQSGNALVLYANSGTPARIHVSPNTPASDLGPVGGASSTLLTSITVEPTTNGNVFWGAASGSTTPHDPVDPIYAIGKTSTTKSPVQFTSDALGVEAPGSLLVRHNLVNDGRFLFWSNSLDVVHAKSITTPSPPTLTIATGELGVRTVAVDATNVYWMTAVPGGVIRRMARVGVAGLK